MASFPLVFLFLLLTLVTGAVAAAVAANRRRLLLARDVATLPGLRLLRRASVGSRALAAVAGLGAAVLVASLDPLGRGVALVPVVVAAVQLAGVVAAEVVTHDAVRVRGRAGLSARRLRDFPVPAGLRRTVVAATLVLGGGLVWTSAVASPDDLGRAGRSFAYTCARGCDGGARGPWPGTFYAVPVGLGLVAVGVLAAVAARVVLRRPRNGGDPDVVRLDDVIRRRSLESVLASVGLAVGGSLAGVAGVAAGVLLGTSELSALDRAAGGPALAAALLGLGLALWSLVVLALPGVGAVSRASSPGAMSPSAAGPGSAS